MKKFLIGGGAIVACAFIGGAGASALPFLFIIIGLLWIVGVL